MLYISKGNAPVDVQHRVSEIKSSAEWKAIEERNTKAIRNKFEELPKESIRESLLAEQHYLCAYCMRKIKNDRLKTSIEHWYPLSKNKDKALDYKNMLVVCDGGKNWSGKGKKILCCDACKGDEDELIISPLNKLQMDKIAYDTNGFIITKPEDGDLDNDIRDVLCLNGIWKNGKFIADTSTGLVKGRKDTYLMYKRFIKKLDDKGRCTSSQIKKKIDEIQSADQWQEYAGVLLYFLNKKYRSLLSRGL